MKPESHPIPEQRCPACQFELIGAFEADGSDMKPLPGMVTICGNCGAVNVLCEGLRLRALGPGEEIVLMGDPEYVRHVREVREKILLFNALQNRTGQARKAGSN